MYLQCNGCFNEHIRRSPNFGLRARWYAILRNSAISTLPVIKNINLLIESGRHDYFETTAPWTLSNIHHKYMHLSAQKEAKLKLHTTL